MLFALLPHYTSYRLPVNNQSNNSFENNKLSQENVQRRYASAPLSDHLREDNIFVGAIGLLCYVDGGREDTRASHALPLI